MSRFRSIYMAGMVWCLFSSFNGYKPKILIIGDSISIGYTPFVKKELAGEAIVSHNAGNAQHTGTGLQKIDQWLGTVKWDIVQFNFGLWDLCYRNPQSTVQGNRDKINGQITHTLEEYTRNLDAIATILEKKTDAKLIYVTTTFVPGREPGRNQEDVRKYNNAAKKIMKKHAIPINDIYGKSIKIHQKWGLGNDNVHYTEMGYEKLSELITPCLKRDIKSFEH